MFSHLIDNLSLYNFNLFTFCILQWQLWHSSAPILLVGTSVGDVWMWKIPSGDCKVMHSRNVSATTAALCPNGMILYGLQISVYELLIMQHFALTGVSIF